MIWFLLASAWACEPTEAIVHLQSGEKIEDYLCLARTTPALAPLVEALLATKDPESAAHTHLSQALSLYLLERSTDNWDPRLLALLSPADRRLLVDGLHARRGRPSPAPAQAKIFEQLGWYKPDPHYTDGRLTAQDLEKIQLLEHPPAPVAPPPAPPPAPAPEAPLPDAPPMQAPIEEAPPVAANSWWSCSSAGGPYGLWIWAALALFRRGSVSKNNG